MIRWLITLSIILFLLTAGCVDIKGNPLGSSNISPLFSSVSIDGSKKVTIQGEDGLGGIQTFKVDNLTQAAVGLSYEHFELHEGHVYSFCAVANISGNGNTTYLMVTPNKSIHIQFSIDTQTEASFKLYEAATTSNNGTPLTAINRNRTSNNTAQSLIYSTPTVTAFGTLLCERHWGSGKGVGGGAEITEEWIFKPNTIYVVVIKNETVSAQWLSADATWYIH